MIQPTALDLLLKPLVLIKTEQKQVCLGHHKFIAEYRSREKAKKDGRSWFNEAKQDSIYKNCRFDVTERRKRKQLLYHLFTHIDDLKGCDHYKIETTRVVHQLVIKQYTELVPMAR